jgi:hypothetical protein
MLLIDNTLREIPLTKISVDTPYLTGVREAQCLPETIYDLIIGNVPGQEQQMNLSPPGKKQRR